MDTFFIQILTIITGFISFILVLRSWFQFCRVPVHLPISQTLLRMTAPVVDPLTRIIPTVKGINFAAILLTVIVLVIEKLVAYSAPLTLSVFMALLGVLKIFGQILFFTTLIRALMSWVTQGNHPLDYVVAQITEPVLPRTGMLDFSVMVLGFILIFVNQLFYSLFGAVWALA